MRTEATAPAATASTSTPKGLPSGSSVPASGDVTATKGRTNEGSTENDAVASAAFSRESLATARITCVWADVTTGACQDTRHGALRATPTGDSSMKNSTSATPFASDAIASSHSVDPATTRPPATGVRTSTDGGATSLVTVSVRGSEAVTCPLLSVAYAIRTRGSLAAVPWTRPRGISRVKLAVLVVKPLSFPQGTPSMWSSTAVTTELSIAVTTTVSVVPSSRVASATGCWIVTAGGESSTM